MLLLIYNADIRFLTKLVCRLDRTSTTVYSVLPYIWLEAVLAVLVASCSFQ